MTINTLYAASPLLCDSITIPPPNTMTWPAIQAAEDQIKAHDWTDGRSRREHTEIRLPRWNDEAKVQDRIYDLGYLLARSSIRLEGADVDREVMGFVVHHGLSDAPRHLPNVVSRARQLRRLWGQSL